MILSMTGYGSAERTEGGVAYQVEIRALNGRYLKITTKVSEGLQFTEPTIDKLVRSRLSRGSVSVSVRSKAVEAQAAYEINVPALQRYLDQLAQVQLGAGLHAGVDFGTLAALPGVCLPPEISDEIRQHQGQVVSELVGQALDALVAMREKEGLALQDDLLANCAALGEQVKAIAALGDAVIQEYQQRLQARVDQLLAQAKLNVDEDALRREVAIYADRSDISEELARMRSHLEQFAQFCDSPEAAGRRLDFLSQEMLREVNTVGSKSNHADIARRVIEMKALIDRLKEQVQNVE